MKRVLLLALGLLVLFLGVRTVVRALASDETKVRWMLERMEEGYNEGDVGDVIARFSKDWTHDGHPGLTREMIRGGLVAEFFQDRDPETKKLLRRVQLDPESMTVEATGGTVTFEVVADFQRHDTGTWMSSWRVRVRGEWREGPEGWFLVRTSHEDLEGTQLSR